MRMSRRGGPEHVTRSRSAVSRSQPEYRERHQRHTASFKLRRRTFRLQSREHRREKTTPSTSHGDRARNRAWKAARGDRAAISNRRSSDRRIPKRRTRAERHEEGSRNSHAVPTAGGVAELSTARADVSARTLPQNRRHTIIPNLLKQAALRTLPACASCSFPLLPYNLQHQVFKGDHQRLVDLLDRGSALTG